VVLAVFAVAATVFIFIQARKTPSGQPDYVALGSSFAAGADLGPLQSGSPLLCARSVNGYPQLLARMRKLSIVDMSCGGAVTANLLNGGQFFQGSQIRAINRETRLVTITVGGNDVGYIGDLSLLAARNSDTGFGWLVRRFWSGPRKPEERHYAQLRDELVATLHAIHQRAPNASVVLATYPAILPRTGTCALLRLSSSEAGLMREVGDRLAATSRSAAAAGGALAVDMHMIGAGHNACSAVPWTRGYTNGGIAPFHPTLAGAKGMAEAISEALNQPRADNPNASAPSGPARSPRPGATRKSSVSPAAV
jgi:lysophospholipase L1-like esterase